MKTKKYSEEQIIGALQEAEAGSKVEDVCRRLGISKVTFYRWKAKFSGMQVSDAKRLRQLEDENRRLKQMVADQALDLQALPATRVVSCEDVGALTDVVRTGAAMMAGGPGSARSRRRRWICSSRACRSANGLKRRIGESSTHSGEGSTKGDQLHFLVLAPRGTAGGSGTR